MSRTSVRVGLVLASSAIALLGGVALWRVLVRDDDGTTVTPAPGSWSPLYSTFGSEPDARVFRPPGTSGDPATTFRIYLIGGSTAAGCPFEDRLDFGRIVAWIFDGKLGGRTIEVRNYAGSGEDSIYELEDARRILDVEKDPAHAVLLLYTGINEFVRWDSAQDLSKRQRKLFDEPLVPPEKAREILDGFEQREREIVSSMRAAGMRVIVSTAAVNLVDWEPERSVLADPSHEAEMQRLLDAGAAASARGDHDAALAAFDAAHALEPHFAWASYQLGRTLRALGRYEEARTALQAAVDDNAAPNAAVSRQNRFLRELAQRESLALVDAEWLVATAEAPVASASNYGLPGFESFWDNCHPTLTTYVCIAEGFAHELARMTGEPMRHMHATAEELAPAIAIDEPYLAGVWHQRGQYFYTASALIWNPTQRLAKSAEYLGLAARARPNDAQIACSQAVLELFRDDPAASRVQWRRAQSLDADVVKQRLRHKFVRGLLARNGVDDGPKWIASGE